MKKINATLSGLLAMMMLSGCSMSMSSTKTQKTNGEVELKKEFKTSRNKNVFKGLATVAGMVITAKLDGGTGVIAGALMTYDIDSKKHALEHEKFLKEKKEDDTDI